MKVFRYVDQDIGGVVTPPPLYKLYNQLKK